MLDTLVNCCNLRRFVGRPMRQRSITVWKREQDFR